jgi:hypothetical protein
VLVMTSDTDPLREEVRLRYAESARAVVEGAGDCGCGSGSCCSDDSVASAATSDKFGKVLYEAEQRNQLPEQAALVSLGCGNPTAVADLHQGEVVLDLGSGGGIDVILSARRVGPRGHRVRARYDRRDARARAAERARGRRHERALREGRDRADPVACRLGRRRDLQLRDQSLDRQGGRALRECIVC